ncbi:hypothetical protein WG66_009345 [Moniliophthora roreri]|nr:hypothetical protein WG66_009345 [Moniliophthora roreri]
MRKVEFDYSSLFSGPRLHEKVLLYFSPFGVRYDYEAVVPNCNCSTLAPSGFRQDDRHHALNTEIPTAPIFVLSHRHTFLRRSETLAWEWGCRPACGPNFGRAQGKDETSKLVTRPLRPQTRSPLMTSCCSARSILYELNEEALSSPDELRSTRFLGRQKIRGIGSRCTRDLGYLRKGFISAFKCYVNVDGLFPAHIDTPQANEPAPVSRWPPSDTPSPTAVRTTKRIDKALQPALERHLALVKSRSGPRMTLDQLCSYPLSRTWTGRRWRDWVI